jgi:hypothetical protein
MVVMNSFGGVEDGGRAQDLGRVFLILLRNLLVIEHTFEYNGSYATRGPSHS